MDLDQLRREYESHPLEAADLAPEPIAQIQRWLADWVANTPHEPSAIVLTTADPRGRPSARNVLLRRIDERGLVFFTSYRSRKAQDLAANPQASILFSWVPVLRQIHVVGSVARVDAAESDAYWATRPRGSQLAAWASEQSSQLADRAILERRFAEVEERYQGGEVPRPPHWGGFRLVPDSVELWQGRANRMHDRLRYQHPDGQARGWEIVRLAP
ncbi:MAG TPA: pyridoxamine 5'-phosphate oxidase [Acidimicrobiales bacterium]|nr:pyridoxamine 5'-phosphate oxidase [Acidimicrobiales bacterium]